MGEPVRIRVVVRGHVQGVFYRDSCRHEATQRGVAGWIHNRDDGAVEAVFEGPRRAVEQLLAWARQGPPGADVTSVETSEEQPDGLTGFRVG